MVDYKFLSCLFVAVIIGVPVNVRADMTIREGREGTIFATDIKPKLTPYEQCRAGKKYRLFWAQENIIALVAQLRELKATQAKEREIEAESRVQNLDAEYLLGVQIVRARDEINRNWTSFKELGGKASAPSKVGHNIKNPCAEFEESE